MKNVILALLLHGLVGGASTGGGGSSPVVTTNKTAVLSTPLATSGAVATLAATNTPTSWTLVSQSCASCYAIDNSGNVTGGTNAANITTENDTITVTATNGSGTSPQQVVTIPAYADGSVNAASCSIQHPTLLNSEVLIPPQKVPGIGYCVGYPTGQTFSTAGVTTPPTGVTANPTNHQFIVGAANVVLDGWDFTPNNGWQVVCTSQCSNLTITHSHFLLGGNATSSNNVNPIYFCTTGDGPGGTCCPTSCATITHGNANVIEYNIVDGGPVVLTANGGTLITVGDGTFDIKWNWIKNSWSDFIQSEAVNGTTIINVRYNVLENSNMDSVDPDVHGDVWQTFGGTYTQANADFNLIIQNNIGQSCVPMASATQGIGFGGNTGPPVFLAESMTYNTTYSAKVMGCGTIGYGLNIYRDELNGTATVTGNYTDGTGITQTNNESEVAWLQDENTFSHAFCGTVNKSNNWSMTTGTGYSNVDGGNC